MKKFMLGIVTAIIFSLILSFGIAVASHNDLERMRSNSSWFSEYKPMPNCHVEVGNARLEYRMQGVKDKAFLTADVFAQCDKFQKNAQVNLEIWKEGFLFAHRVVRIQNDPSNLQFSGHDLKFINLGIDCKNSKISTYYAVASVSATIGGSRKETPQIYSVGLSKLPCGT